MSQKDISGARRWMPSRVSACTALLCCGQAATADSAALIKTAVLAGDAKSIRIAFVSGRSKSFGVEELGATFGPPRLSPDRRVASWEERRRDISSYASAVGIAIYAHRHLRYVGCNSGMPWAWRLLGDNRIALNCAFPHGQPSRYLLLTDIASGKSLAKVELGDSTAAPPNAPKWARGAFSE